MLYVIRSENQFTKKVVGIDCNKVKGLVNYKLKLLRIMKIHPVFHVSLLEKVLANVPLVPVTEVE